MTSSGTLRLPLEPPSARDSPVHQEATGASRWPPTPASVHRPFAGRGRCKDSKGEIPPQDTFFQGCRSLRPLQTHPEGSGPQARTPCGQLSSRSGGHPPWSSHSVPAAGDSGWP